MKRINYFLITCLVAIILISLTGCNKQDKVIIPVDPEGTVIVFMRNGSNDAKQTYILPVKCNFPFYINNSNNFEGDGEREDVKWKFVIIPEAKGLADVTEIPQNADWTTQIAVKKGYGYIGQCFNGENESPFVRIYVPELILNSSGDIIGAEVKYQSPFIPVNSTD